jgi:hypothetical protein
MHCLQPPCNATLQQELRRSSYSLLIQLLCILLMSYTHYTPQRRVLFFAGLCDVYPTDLHHSSRPYSPRLGITDGQTSLFILHTLLSVEWNRNPVRNTMTNDICVDTVCAKCDLFLPTCPTITTPIYLLLPRIRSCDWVCVLVCVYWYMNPLYLKNKRIVGDIDWVSVVLYC